MKNIVLFAMTALVVLQACKKNDQTAVQGRFQLVENKSSVDGNLVMGQGLTSDNTFTLAYKNAGNGTNAVISADTVNGLYIAPTTVSLKGDSMRIPLSGKPVTDGTFNMIVNVKTGNTIYVCTKEFYVDVNATSITSSLPADTTVYNVFDSSKINFLINPHSTVFSITAPAHITALITNNSATSRTITFYADNQFLTGDVVVTATFRALTPVVSTIHLSTFAGGNGTATNPFQVADTGRLNKLQYAPDKAYLLTANIVAPKPALSSVTLTGSLDGNGKTISNYAVTATANNTGFLAAIGASGVVKNVTFSNIAVTGKDYTGGVVAVNNGTITNVTITGTVSGANYTGGIAGNNLGTISSCDASSVNVNGLNYIATLAGNTNSGSSQTGNVVLSTATTFPTQLYSIAAATTVPLTFTPASGTIAITTPPVNVAATAGPGQQVVLAPQPGFITSSMRLTLKAGNLSCTRDVALFSKAAGAVFDAGDGSSANPYLITTEQAFDSIIKAPSKYYQLGADITLTKTWVTIPSFSGSLDGKGHVVNGLVISATAVNSGLVGTNTGTIKNMQVLGVNGTTSASSFGIIAGTNNAGTIQNIVASGTITSTAANDTLGGLAAILTNGGKVTQCYAKLTITAACGMVGGLVGCLTTTATASEISYSGTAGSIEITAAKNRVGGILGRGAGTVVSGGVIKNCSSSMNIKSSGTAGPNANGFGGIFGADQNAGIVPIDQCLFTGTVVTGFSIGGIAGVGSNITNCIVTGQGPALGTPTLYANGTAPATGSVGGIAGTGKNAMQYCIVKNATLNALVTSSTLAIGGTASTYQNNGYTTGCVVVNTSITGSATAPNSEFAYRVTGSAANGSGANSNNYVGTNVTTPGRTAAFVDNTSGLDGQLQASLPFSFFTGIGFSSAIWKTDTDGYPTLINTGYNGGYPLPQ